MPPKMGCTQATLSDVRTGHRFFGLAWGTLRTTHTAADRLFWFKRCTCTTEEYLVGYDTLQRGWRTQRASASS